METETITGFSDGRAMALSLSDSDLATLFAGIAAIARKRLLARRKPVMDSWQIVLDYLGATMAELPQEQFRVLYLNKRNGLIADEVMANGTIDHVPVYPREILRRAIELRATAVILAHNHPGGDSTPSHADLAMTKQVIEVLKLLGIAVHDHVIVSRYCHTSMKALKLI